MARPKGFEPLTPRFVVWCSIQLSYGRLFREGRRTYASDPPMASLDGRGKSGIFGRAGQGLPAVGRLHLRKADSNFRCRRFQATYISALQAPDGTDLRGKSGLQPAKSNCHTGNFATCRILCPCPGLYPWLTLRFSPPSGFELRARGALAERSVREKTLTA